MSLTIVFFHLLRSTQNPAFGAAQIRELTDVFIEKSLQVSLTYLFMQCSVHKHTLSSTA